MSDDIAIDGELYNGLDLVYGMWRETGFVVLGPPLRGIRFCADKLRDLCPAVESFSNSAPPNGWDGYGSAVGPKMKARGASCGRPGK